MDDENDLDNIFVEYENEDVQESNNEPENEENPANGEANEVQTREVVPVPKRIIRNPRLKFDAERLIGARGIPIVTKHFKNVKFKGKGHEKEDLKKLLSTLEHWSHRLFPSMKFEACLKQIEKLGKKRAVQTCLIKIRRDMPILASDFVQDEDENEKEETQNEADFDLPPQDAFDRLFGDSREVEFPTDTTSTPRNTAPSGFALGTSFGGSLTEEQRQRMEYNKMLATERRKAKMAAMQVSTREDSGRMSPSVLEPEFSKNAISNPPLESSNLDQQFESLFDEPNREVFVHKDSKKKDYESMCDDSLNNMSSSALESTSDIFLLESSSNLNQQSESLFDRPNRQTLISEDSKNKDYESTCYESENNQLTCEDSDMPATFDASEKNVCELSSDGLKRNYQELEKSQSTLQGDSAKYQWESNHVDSERDCSISIHDSVTNPHESVDVSEANQCESKNATDENAAEELGIDELMDLVDEDETTST